MTAESDCIPCERTPLVVMHVLRALSANENRLMEVHLSECDECRTEAVRLCSGMASLAFWPTDVLRPSFSLWERLSERIYDSELAEAPVATDPVWVEPAWEPVAPGIECKLLASDPERRRVSMLVRLAAGTEYPAYTHAGIEELHLLHGELWIDERRLEPGDYNRAERGSSDKRVWSATGCTCVLVTSTEDLLA